MCVIKNIYTNLGESELILSWSDASSRANPRPVFSLVANVSTFLDSVAERFCPAQPESQLRKPRSAHTSVNASMDEMVTYKILVSWISIDFQLMCEPDLN